MRIEFGLRSHIIPRLVVPSLCGALAVSWVAAAPNQPSKEQSTVEEEQTIARGWDVGNYQNGIDDLKALYGYINSFRSQHDGDYPRRMIDILNVIDSPLPPPAPKRNFDEANKLSDDLTNPDSQYSDSSTVRTNSKNFIPYNVISERVDGTSTKAPRDPGTRDVMAQTGLYVHQGPFSSKEGVTNNPHGDYLVLWNDGEVQTVPYDQALRSLTSRGFAITFRGQTSLPFNTLTYAEFHGTTETSGVNIGKPIPKGIDAPIKDNGGPEALVNLSRLIEFKGLYGVDRRQLWQNFDPSQINFTLQQLLDSSSNLGLQLCLRHLSLDDIANIRSPVIFRNKEDNRIVTLSNFDGQEAIIIDEGVFRIVNRDRLAIMYGGDVLLPENAFEHACPLVIENSIRTLNLKSPDEEVSVNVVLKNTGQQPVDIALEPTILGCTGVHLSSSTVIVGGKETLTLKLRWRPVLKTSYQNIIVNIKTSDPNHPILQLGFRLDRLME